MAAPVTSGQEPGTVRQGTPRATAADVHRASMSGRRSSTVPPSPSSAAAAAREGVSAATSGAANWWESNVHGSAGAPATISGGTPRPPRSTAHRSAASPTAPELEPRSGVVRPR